MAAEILVVANQKGGIGKTTTALALFDCLHHRGKKCLYVDLDPQCNGTDNLCVQVDGVGTAYDLLVDGDMDCIQQTDRGDVIAGDPLLKDAPKQLDGVSGNYRLREGLAAIRERYDFIIVDTPPALSVLLINALTAADKVIIPLTADRFGLQGLVQLKETIIEIRKYTNPNLTVAGLLLIKYSDRTNLAKNVYGNLPEYAALFDSKIYETKIRESVKAREAQAGRKSLYEWASSCTTAEDYNALISEMIEKGDLSNG